MLVKTVHGGDPDTRPTSLLTANLIREFEKRQLDRAQTRATAATRSTVIQRVRTSTASYVRQARSVVALRKILLIVIGMLLSSSAFAQQTRSLDVKVGQRIKLRDMGGPNVQLIVNGVDQFDISVTLIDYEHMRFVRTNGSYGYQQPGITNEQFKIADLLARNRGVRAAPAFEALDLRPTD